MKYQKKKKKTCIIILNSAGGCSQTWVLQMGGPGTRYPQVIYEREREETCTALPCCDEKRANKRIIEERTRWRNAKQEREKEKEMNNAQVN